MKTYTVEKIGRMRAAIRCHIIFGCRPSNLSGTRTSDVFQEGEVDRHVEEQLRTYLFAGTEPEELE